MLHDILSSQGIVSEFIAIPGMGHELEAVPQDMMDNVWGAF